MEHIIRGVRKTGVFGWLYIAAIFHAFHFFSIHFVNSSFLEQYLTQTEVGLMFAASNALTLVALLSVVVFLNKFGNYLTILFVTGLNLISTLGLTFCTDIGWLFVMYTLHTVMLPITLFCFDVFLEAYTKDESTTGSVRGVFLLVTMIAALFSPIISGWVIGEEAVYQNAYLLGAVYLVPVLLLLAFKFRSFIDPAYEVLSLSSLFNTLRTNKNIFHIISAQFVLRFFFSWMVVYMPIFLHQNIGFSWLEIGIILFVMLVPYVVLELPAGIVADKWLGEKELLFAGFIITGLSTFSLFFVNSTSLVVWASVLFVTRIGAAFIESMTETYFFKQIDGDDTSILSVFRILRPLAYTVGPFSGGAVLFFLGGDGITYLWPILGVIVLFGTINALSIKDTL